MMLSPPSLNDTLRDWTKIFLRRSMREFQQFTRHSGLSITHLNTLMQLHHCGSCGVSHVAVHLGVSNAAASQMIDRLVQGGWIERREDPADRRGKQLTLTPQGDALLYASIEARRKWMEDLTQKLTPVQQEQIVAALTLLIEAAQSLDVPGETVWVSPQA